MTKPAALAPNTDPETLAIKRALDAAITAMRADGLHPSSLAELAGMAVAYMVSLNPRLDRAELLTLIDAYSRAVRVIAVPPPS